MPSMTMFVVVDLWPGPDTHWAATLHPRSKSRAKQIADTTSSMIVATPLVVARQMESNLETFINTATIHVHLATRSWLLDLEASKQAQALGPAWTGLTLVSRTRAQHQFCAHLLCVGGHTHASQLIIMHSCSWFTQMLGPRRGACERVLGVERA